jgi:hypothetical protein
MPSPEAAPAGDRARGDGGPAAPPGGDAATQAEWWLLGQPTLQGYLTSYAERVPGGDEADPRALCGEWRAANDRYAALERREAGASDAPGTRPLDPEFAPFAAAVEAHPAYRGTFDTLPTRLAMVELDRLVVFQHHVVLDHVEAVKARLGRRPSPEAVFRLCHPLDRPAPAVEARRLSSRRWSFTSEAPDFRFHEAALLAAAAPPGRRRCLGPVGGVLGVVLGFGANFLNAIESDGRLVLHNGYHRAVALRALRLTHAPCVLQTVTRRDELQLVAARTVAEEPAFWFRAARPPLLRDFFDPALRKALRVRRARRVVEVEFEVREHDVLV